MNKLMFLCIFLFWYSENTDDDIHKKNISCVKGASTKLKVVECFVSEEIVPNK